MRINHADWPKIRARILLRARYQCECVGECGLHPGDRCIELDGTHAKFAKGVIVLTVAHLDCDAGAGNHSDDNLKAMCQRCHNRMDAPSRARNRAANQRAKVVEAGQGGFL